MPADIEIKQEEEVSLDEKDCAATLVVIIIPSVDVIMEILAATEVLCTLLSLLSPKHGGLPAMQSAGQGWKQTTDLEVLFRSS